MRNVRNRLCAIFLSLLCVAALCPTQAFAAGAIDLSKEVELTISYQHKGTAVAGIPFDLYYVADVDTYCTFTLAGDFAQYPVQVNDLTSDEWKTAAETLKSYADRDQRQPLESGETGADGRLRFPGKQSALKPGLYLVVGRTATVAGYTYTTEPFLVALPSLEKKTDTWTYSVNTVPKYTRDEVPPTPDKETVDRKAVKVWKDNGYEKQRPKKVTVQLLKNGSVYDTVTLQAENNWRYSWKKLPKWKDGQLIDWRVVEKEQSGYTVTVTQEGGTFLVTNTYRPDHPTPPGDSNKKPSKLPQTGMLWWPVPVLAVCGILFVIVGTLTKGKKRDE